MKLTAGRLVAAASVTFCVPVALWAADFKISPEVRETLDAISADSLRGHVSFLASDALEGRDTPSLGLTIAAEYIAAQFRRAGLEPGGDDGYFQTANFVNLKPNFEGFELAVESDGQSVSVPAGNVALGPALTRFELTQVPAIKVSLGDLIAATEGSAPEWEGKVILTEAAPPGSLSPGEERQAALQLLLGVRSRVTQAKPAAVIVLTRGVFGREKPSLMDADEAAKGQRFIRVNDEGLRKLYQDLKPGATVSLKIAAPVQESVKLRNVVGILRGADPVLKDTYVLVTAHYDHLGLCASGADRICNGANDDASGTASMLELASALAKMSRKPGRSMAFIAYFGEERGLLGSRYYARHPVLPLAKTVADINLEQMGRTDDSEGPQVGCASLTGFGYSTLSETLVRAGQLTGVPIAGGGKRSDPYFARSDNQSLADVGIPAHTIAVAYDYPDYHKPSDEWQKLDYANMAKVDRMVAVAALMVAANPDPPKWNEANSRTARYVKTWKQRMGN